MGDVWARLWRRTDRSLADLAVHLNEAIHSALPGGPTRIADIGCGAGATSIAAAAIRADVDIMGFDLSDALVAIARERAAGLPNCHFTAGPVERTIVDAMPFDLVMSRHGVMFFDDPVAGLAVIRSAARPGAPLVFSCFRAPALNRWATDMIAALPGDPPPPPSGYEPGPFAFADERFVRTCLDAAGWIDAQPMPVDFRYVAGERGEGAENGAVADAVDFFSRIGPAARLLATCPPEEHAGIRDAIARLCEAHRDGDIVAFPAAAWIWTARNSH
ncbi:MAG: class I SAM-dependent methyltransferase [Sphingobium sp.]